MILNNAINAGNFVYCMANFSPNESHTYQNIGNGHFHQFLYVVSGRAEETIEDQDGNVVLFDDSDREGELVDMTELKGTVHKTKTTDTSISFITFNPVPDTRQLAVEILKGPSQHTVTAESSRKTIVCITGTIKVNDKELSTLQHAKIFPGKTVEITMPENTVCAIVSDK